MEKYYEIISKLLSNKRYDKFFSTYRYSENTENYKKNTSGNLGNINLLIPFFDFNFWKDRSIIFNISSKNYKGDKPYNRIPKNI